MIKLFASTATSFTTMGLGALKEAITCKVTEERNGIFEMEMTYPITGSLYSSISLRSIICAAPNPDDGLQPFRVYKISRPINGIVTIYAQHLSYDLSGYITTPYTANGIQAALAGLSSNSLTAVPFAFVTSRSAGSTFTLSKPSTIRAALGGTSGSILDTYGGEWKFDMWKCINYANRGSNRKVTIEYGKNITDLKQEENNANVYTGILPYWIGSDGTTVYPSAAISLGVYSYTRLLLLDCSSDFEEQPTTAQLSSRAMSYASKNYLTSPKVDITVSFQNLRDTEEYKTLAALETIKLCDTVKVKFAKLGVSASAKVVKTVYDAVGEKFISIQVTSTGKVASTFADTIVNIQNDVEEKTSVAQANNAALTASELITGNNGGYVLIHDSDGDGFPDEILVMDTADISTATNVWRWNSSGWGYSSTGYSGTYTLAATINGQISADFITAGTMSADRISTGLLESVNFAYATGYAHILTSSLAAGTYQLASPYPSDVTYYFRFTSTMTYPSGAVFARTSANAYNVYTDDTMETLLETVTGTTSTTDSGDAIIIANACQYLPSFGAQIDLDEGTIITGTMRTTPLNDKMFRVGRFEFCADGSSVLCRSLDAQGTANGWVRLNPDGASQFGGLQAIPYTNTASTVYSEVVTKKDLQNLGLIP